RDRVREYLEKNPSDRTEKEVQFLLDFMQHMPAFSNMTMSMKQSLCSIMVFAGVEKSGTVILSDGEKLDSWSVILNGHVEVGKPDGTIQHLHMGDSFGVSPTNDVMYHEGVMITKSDDCQFVCIPQRQFYDILHREKENIIKVQNENGEVTMVMEKREMLDEKSSRGFVQGQVVLRATPEMLMRHLMDRNLLMDVSYVPDFLLTYRTFYKQPADIAQYLTDCLQVPETFDKAFEVMHTWLANHFIDFESNVDLFNQLESFLGALRDKEADHNLTTLHAICSCSAHMRQILLVLKSEVEPLNFVLSGGTDRGSDMIFVCDVVKNSPAAKSGLRIGDQVISVNNQSLEGLTLKRAYDVIQSTNHLMITVKSNIFGLFGIF
ncbi:hypothetical protein HELRODRAFT_82965, partial [Helobdella robusta]|uniref:PDZ domain-containing protein n=1 Tax=Helobdella robusta TaxID=6412 RepID=T1G4Y5_HELRO